MLPLVFGCSLLDRKYRLSSSTSKHARISGNASIGWEKNSTISAFLTSAFLALPVLMLSLYRFAEVVKVVVHVSFAIQARYKRISGKLRKE